MAESEKGTATGVFFLADLDCSGCAGMITNSLKKLTGIRDVGINYVTDKVYVSYDPARLTPEQIRQTIAKAGYKAFEVTHRRGA